MDDDERVITVREAGKRGGQRVAAKYGREYFSNIGKKGGLALSEKSDGSFYVENGKKGGSTCRQKRSKRSAEESTTRR